MHVIKTTGLDQVEFLGNNYDGGKVAIKAVGGLCHYVPCKNLAALNDVNAIRETEVEEITTGMSEDAAGVIEYTTADATVYRKGETLPVLQSGVQVGAVNVRDNSAGLILTVDKSNGSVFIAASGDTLARREDPFIAEDDANKFNSSQYTHLKLNSESASVKLVVEKLDQGLIKKF